MSFTVPNDTTIRKITRLADNDDRVRIVLLNGSRANPNVVPDRYSDYDVVFAVDPMTGFGDVQNSFSAFGHLLISQTNVCRENGVEFPIYLMQFDDGLRIDLTVYPADKISGKLSDSLTVVLLDKDSQIGKLPEPGESSYLLKKPSEDEYTKTLNEFWWCVIYAAKGIARKELCYAKFMYESVVRECFVKIVSWYAAETHGWNINTGKFGRFLDKYLPGELWDRILLTYSDHIDAAFWKSLYLSCDIVQELDGFLRDRFGYRERQERDADIVEFIRQIEKDANSPQG